MLECCHLCVTLVLTLQTIHSCKVQLLMWNMMHRARFQHACNKWKPFCGICNTFDTSYPVYMSSKCNHICQCNLSNQWATTKLLYVVYWFISLAAAAAVIVVVVVVVIPWCGICWNKFIMIKKREWETVLCLVQNCLYQFNEPLSINMSKQRLTNGGKQCNSIGYATVYPPPPPNKLRWYALLFELYFTWIQFIRMLQLLCLLSNTLSVESKW